MSASGYVGEVLSTNVVGSGGIWGATVRPGDHYVLDAANGATLLAIPFSHTLDGLASVLGKPGAAAGSASRRAGPRSRSRYQQFLDDLREGTSAVLDFAHGAARHRSIAPAMTTA